MPLPMMPMPTVLATRNPMPRSGGISPETADLIGAGIQGGADLFGAWMQDRASRKAMEASEGNRRGALAFERERYEDAKKWDAEDRAYRNAIRKAWAEKHGVDWSPTAGGSGTLGALGGLPARRVAPVTAEVEAAPVDMTNWSEWR